MDYQVQVKGILKELGIDWIVWIGAPGTEKFYTACNAAIMEDYIPYRLN